MLIAYMLCIENRYSKIYGRRSYQISVGCWKFKFQAKEKNVSWIVTNICSSLEMKKK